MAAGSVQTIAICGPAIGPINTAGRSISCGTDASGNPLYVTTMQAYVLTPSSASYIDAIAQPFDYVQAAGFWGLAFTTVISLWLVSHGAGAIVNFVRRA
ncbi:hypothetical protein C0Z18_09770 [Trinickia dabaoshanensis]|uniref:Uncharacterized protein n=1 Tax=Trinickia dabaoshanensis TaxID=564714 RepID=A0A2N7VUJ2_9BURK|nr:hypothetical protein [Trinickia dabaoshanensis]PMS20817.1 hypothetical protein C0Z18_09770 [Trinickia dabaoshanensis]